MKYIESEANKKINQVDILSKNISKNSWSRSYKEISVARMRKRGDRSVRTQDQRWECGTLCNCKGPAPVVMTEAFFVKSLVRFWVWNAINPFTITWNSYHDYCTRCHRYYRETRMSQSIHDEMMSRLLGSD